METLNSYLPPAQGLLPRWLLFISIVSIGNSIQAYRSLTGTREVYSAAGAPPDPAIRPPQHRDPHPQVTHLQARTFGTWTALSSIVRLYAAYNIHEPKVYELALWSFALAGAHFFSEWMVFGTANMGRGLAGPVAVASVTGVWMLVQWEYYVK